MRLKDKVVLIAASTRGIGLACVKKCAKEGARVYMAARNVERAQDIADTMDGVKFVYNDATKPETFTSMVEDVVKDAGRIDVSLSFAINWLFNNVAGTVIEFSYHRYHLLSVAYYTPKGV